jgi:hypothetical protein
MKLRIAVDADTVRSTNRSNGDVVTSGTNVVAWNTDPSLIAFQNELPSFINLIANSTVINISEQVDRKVITYQQGVITFYRTVYNQYNKATDILYRDIGLSDILCRRNF